MEIAFDFKNRTMCVNLSNGNSFRVELNLVSLFLIANLMCTITWLVPSAHKQTWIGDLQKHLDMASETEFNNRNILNHGKAETKED